MARPTPRYGTRYPDLGPDRYEFRRKSVTQQVCRRIRLNLPDLPGLRTGGDPNSKTRMGIPPENFGHLALKFDESAGVVQRLGMRPMVCSALRRISDQGGGYRRCYGRVPVTHDSANLAASYTVVLPFLAVLCIFLKAHMQAGIDAPRYALLESGQHGARDGNHVRKCQEPRQGGHRAVISRSTGCRYQPRLQEKTVP